MLYEVITSGFHRNLQALLALGAIYVVASMAILGLSALFDGGVLFRIVITSYSIHYTKLYEQRDTLG